MGYKVQIGISGKHIHLSQEDLFKLFGEGYELNNIRDLVQPGQFAADEKVDFIGPKRSYTGVRIIGPTRPKTQVEISLTDAIYLGVEPVIRESGKLDGTPGLKIKGPKGEVELSEGVIVAKRHIHLNPEQSKESGFTNGQIVKVKVNTEERSLIFDDVVVRTGDAHEREFHLDTDEANASNLKPGMEIEILE